jgi:hypothetical protein
VVEHIAGEQEHVRAHGPRGRQDLTQRVLVIAVVVQTEVEVGTVDKDEFGQVQDGRSAAPRWTRTSSIRPARRSRHRQRPLATLEDVDHAKQLEQEQNQDDGRD